MVEKEQIGPRISAELKRTFERHLERERGGYKGPLGDEIEQAIQNWLAVYYLVHEEARADVPEEDRKVIEKAIETHSYEINRASEALSKSRASPKAAVSSDPLSLGTSTQAQPDQSQKAIQWGSDEPEQEPETDRMSDVDVERVVKKVIDEMAKDEH